LLYARLVDDGIVETKTANLLTGGKKKRQEHIVSTIRQTAADKPKAFHHTLILRGRHFFGKPKSEQIESRAPQHLSRLHLPGQTSEVSETSEVYPLSIVVQARFILVMDLTNLFSTVKEP